MVVGIGTDICDAQRIAAAIEDSADRFLKKIFTPAEREVGLSKPKPEAYFAKRFAAKEAIYKALQPSGVAGRGWQDAEILNDADGAPTVRLDGACKRALEAMTPSGYNAHVDLSLSDEWPYAVAFVVISVRPS